MADKKISALTGASTPLAGTEVLPIVQSGATVKVAVSALTAGRAVTTGALSVVAGTNATTTEKLVLNTTDASSNMQLILSQNGTTSHSIQSVQQGVGYKPLVLQPDGSNVNVGSGNLSITTTGKGITTGSAIPLGFGTNNAVSAATIDTSNNFNIGQTTAISGAKLTVNGQIATSPYFGINASTATTVATGVSFLAVFRCRGNGGTALVLYETGQTPVIISQSGTVTFVTIAPIGNQIQLANGGNSITALSGATVGNNNLNVTVIQNQ